MRADWLSTFFILEKLSFPHPLLADQSGILCVGGDLNPKRLILAYSHGIFPWYSEGDPIIWWFPDPRCVLFPDKLKVAKSMRPLFNQKRFRVTYDERFSEVIDQCSKLERKDQEGTWLTDEMISAYKTLHNGGIAHSVEVWQGEKLVGGLYGIALGKIFFGESMFSLEKNASKFGFITLVNHLITRGYVLIDCQQDTPHMRSLGAELLSADEFYQYCENNLNVETDPGKWTGINYDH